MDDQIKRKKVVCPISSGNGKTYWRTLGTAFTNKDGSINLYLDAYPANGKLQVRDWDAQMPWERTALTSVPAPVDGPGHAQAMDQDVPF